MIRSVPRTPGLAVRAGLACGKVLSTYSARWIRLGLTGEGEIYGSPRDHSSGNPVLRRFRLPVGKTSDPASVGSGSTHSGELSQSWLGSRPAGPSPGVSCSRAEVCSGATQAIRPRTLFIGRPILTAARRMPRTARNRHQMSWHRRSATTRRDHDGSRVARMRCAVVRLVHVVGWGWLREGQPRRRRRGCEC